MPTARYLPVDAPAAAPMWRLPSGGPLVQQRPAPSERGVTTAPALPQRCGTAAPPAKVRQGARSPSGPRTNPSAGRGRARSGRCARRKERRPGVEGQREVEDRAHLLTYRATSATSLEKASTALTRHRRRIDPRARLRAYG